MPITSEGGLGRLFHRVMLIAALVAAVGLFAAACGDDDDDGNGNGNGDETSRTIEMGYVPGWDEGVAATFLWEHILEEEGYDVNLTTLEIAALFAGIANDDVDIYLDAWLPGTHEVYIEEFGEDINQLSVWYEPAGLYLTVPSYVDATSLEDLSEMAETFDSQIIGIEPGAGMMGILAEDVMPTYGLEDWELVESSTPAMLAELESAINNEEPIVVTLWSPGWWYGEYDLRNLEDPENAWGDPDQLWIVTSTPFEERYPQLTEWLTNFEMNDDQLSELENIIRDHGEGNEAEAVEEWLSDEENQALVDGWLGR